MASLHLVRVFTNRDGDHGNPLAVFASADEIPGSLRQGIAADLELSETVFVDGGESGQIHIFSPNTELPFAGHPLVGAAWVLRYVGREARVLRPPAGEVASWYEDGLTWIRARSDWLPDWEQIELASPAAVMGLRDVDPRHDLTQFWAWEDESAGLIRARVFAPRIGIAEDEACGSASLRLAHRLARPIMIIHGLGSIILARPGPERTVEIGGQVVLDKVRNHPS